MPTYRAYLIDGDDRVTSYKPVDAETDAEALRAARQFVDGCDVEVWHLDRKIGRLEREKKNNTNGLSRLWAELNHRNEKPRQHPRTLAGSFMLSPVPRLLHLRGRGCCI